MPTALPCLHRRPSTGRISFRKQGSLPTRYGSHQFQSLGRQDTNLQPACYERKLLQLVTRGVAQLGVEIRQRLVKRENDRLTHHRARKGDALTLSSRQLTRLSVKEAANRGVISRHLGAPGEPQEQDGDARENVLVLANILATALAIDFRDKWLVRLLILLPWVAPISLGSIGWLWNLRFDLQRHQLDGARPDNQARLVAHGGALDVRPAPVSVPRRHLAKGCISSSADLIPRNRFIN